MTLTNSLPRASWLVAVLALVVGCATLGSQPTPAQPQTQTLFGATAIAGTYRDSSSVELGVQFTVTQNASATGVRFFKPEGAIGVHKGYLYRGNTKVAEVTYTNETASGWQEALFTTPVALAPGTTYIASYLSPSGVHADTDPFKWPVTSGILKATTAVYKFGPGGSVPTSTTAENYGADVIVAVGAAPSTSTPAPTTTQAPPTTTEPTTSTTPPAAYPGADNTGPTGALTVVHGDQEIREPGTVIDGKDIRGCVIVKAANVTIRNSQIACGSWGTVINDNGSPGLVVEDSEISCDNARGSGLIWMVNARVSRVDIHSCENGIDAGDGVTVEDSYIHDLLPYNPQTDPHVDGIQAWGGSDMTIRHNTILAGDGTSAMILQNNPSGPAVANLLVQNNLVAGGAYTVYCPRSATTNVRVLDNRFSTRFYPKAGAFGPTSDCADEITSGNVYHETGQPVPVS